MANLSVATTRSWKDRNSGEWKEATEWHNVSVNSEGLVGYIESKCKKGDIVVAQGESRTRKWQDRDGNDRYITEVVIGGFSGTFRRVPVPGAGQGGSGGGSGGGGGSSWNNRDNQGGGVGSWGSGGSSGGGWGGGGSGGDGGTKPYETDLDDDVPF